MTLEVDKEKMMIMGVIFDNKKVFKSVWFALSTNMIEGWHPTVEAVSYTHLPFIPIPSLPFR